VTATAADIMESHVVSVGPSTPLSNLYQLFSDEGISGAPVVDETGKLLGVISSSDLLRVLQEDRALPSDSDYFREGVVSIRLDGIDVQDEFRERMGGLTVADAMTTDPVVVSAETPVPEIARLLRDRQIHRVLVTNGDALDGIVSTFDLIRLLEAG
jgi:CBS domain-containing protein